MISSWLPVLVWMGLIYYVSDIPSLKTSLGVWDFVLRKCAHMTEFAILMALMVRAWRRTRPQWNLKTLLTVSGLLSLLYAVSDEIHQSFVAGRQGSATDVLIDGCGIMVALLIYRHMGKKA